MGRDAQIILAEALMLRNDERAELAAGLIASLDEPASIAQEEVDRVWAVKVERRSRQMLRGESVGVPWEVVRARTERNLAGTESTMASKSAPYDLWFDATTVGPDLVVETWIEHSPRARGIVRVMDGA